MVIFSKSPVKMSKHNCQHCKMNKRKKSNSGRSSKNDRHRSSTADDRVLSEVSCSSCDSIPEALSTAEHKIVVEHLWQVHEQEFEKYYAKPESHPKYYVEWTQFVQKRSLSILEFGENPVSYDFVSEWKEFWKKRLRELEVEEWNEKKRTTLKLSSEYTKSRSSHQSSLSHRRRKASISSESSCSSRSRTKRRKHSKRHENKRSKSRKYKGSHKKGLQRKIKSNKRVSHSKVCKGSKRSRSSSTNKSSRSSSSSSSSSSTSKSLRYRSRSRSSSGSSSCIRGKYIEYGKIRSRSSVKFRSTSFKRSRSEGSYSISRCRSSGRTRSLSSSKSRGRSSDSSLSGSCVAIRSENVHSSESKNSSRFRGWSSSGFKCGSPRPNPSHHFHSCSSNALNCALKVASKCMSGNPREGRSSYHISKNCRKSKHKEHNKSKSFGSLISKDFKIQSKKHTNYKSKEHSPCSSKDRKISNEKEAESCGTKWSKAKSPRPKASFNLRVSKIKDDKDKPRNEVINGEEGCKHPKTVSSVSSDGITSPWKDRRQRHGCMGQSAKTPESKCTSSIFRADIELISEYSVKVESSKFKEESNNLQSRSKPTESRSNSLKLESKNPVLRNTSPRPRHRKLWNKSPNSKYKSAKPKHMHSDVGSESSPNKSSMSRSSRPESDNRKPILRSKSPKLRNHRSHNKSPNSSKSLTSKHIHSDRSKSPKSGSKTPDLRNKNTKNEQEIHEYRKTSFSSRKGNGGCSKRNEGSRRYSFEHSKAIPEVRKQNPESPKGINQSRKESHECKKTNSESREKGWKTREDSVNDRNKSRESKIVKSSSRLKTPLDRIEIFMLRKSLETRKKSPNYRNTSHFYSDQSNRFRNTSHFYSDQSNRFRNTSHFYSDQSNRFRNTSHFYSDQSNRFRNASHGSINENMKSNKECRKLKNIIIDLESDSSQDECRKLKNIIIDLVSDSSQDDAKPSPPTVTQEIDAKHLLSSPVCCSSNSILGAKDPTLPGLEKLDREQLSHTHNDSSDRCDIVRSPRFSFLKKTQSWLSALESLDNCTPGFFNNSKMKSPDARAVEQSESAKHEKDEELTAKTEDIFRKESSGIDDLSIVKTNNPLHGVKEVLPNHDLYPTQSPVSSINVPVLTKKSPMCVKLSSHKETHEKIIKPRMEGFCGSLDLDSIKQRTLNSETCLDNRYDDSLMLFTPQSSYNSSSSKTKCLTHLSGTKRGYSVRNVSTTFPRIKTGYSVNVSRTIEWLKSQQQNSGNLSNDENSQVDNLGLPTDRKLMPHVTLDVSQKSSFLPKVKSGKIVRTLKLLCDLGDALDNLAPQVMSIYCKVLEKEKIGQDPKDYINQADIKKIINSVYGKLKASVDSETVGFIEKTIRMEIIQQIEDMLEIGQNLHDKTYGLDMPDLARCFLYFSREEIVDSIRNALIYKGKYAPTVDIVTELYSRILDEQLKLV